MQSCAMIGAKQPEWGICGENRRNRRTFKTHPLLPVNAVAQMAFLLPTDPGLNIIILNML
jgi:hypothetical protein